MATLRALFDTSPWVWLAMLLAAIGGLLAARRYGPSYRRFIERNFGPATEEGRPNDDKGGR